jgi:hypothetical protein
MVGKEFESQKIIKGAQISSNSLLFMMDFISEDIKDGE